MRMTVSSTNSCPPDRIHSSKANKGKLDIDALIRQNRAFAVCRIPGETRFHFTGQTKGTVRILSSIESLNEQSGFVIAPFRVSDKCPIVLIEPYEESVYDIRDATATSGVYERIKEEPPIFYQSLFSDFTQALADEAFEKLVLSNYLITPRYSEFSPAMVFYRACKRYIHSYVYLFHTPETGTWMGSTPEVLLSGKRNKWHTVALAGTQQLLKGKLPKIWDEKKQKEQQLVADYVRNCLFSFHIDPKEKGPYTVQAGELSHLKTDFRFSLPKDLCLGELLKVLHPTPAVCGLPKDKAFRFINENEGYDRRYYSGFIGRTYPKGQTDLYVNLRCMQIDESRLTLYAGCGLLASSDMKEEWSETKDKLLTMYRIIG
jgi:isochorismate synthase